MGGVWLPAIMYCNLKPLLWCSRFPATITAQHVSYENPTGTITNLDLKLAGAIAHQDVLQQEVNCASCTIVPLTDNTPTLSWQHKGSTLTTSPAAYLLHVASLHQ